MLISVVGTLSTQQEHIVSVFILEIADGFCEVRKTRDVNCFSLADIGAGPGDHLTSFWTYCSESGLTDRIQLSGLLVYCILQVMYRLQVILLLAEGAHQFNLGPHIGERIDFQDLRIVEIDQAVIGVFV